VSLIERTFREKIVLVGVVFPGSTPEEVEESLDELARLVDTAGADVEARIVQRRDAPDPATYVGKGKAEELHRVSLAVDSDTVVFDDELSPAQQRNLEKILGRTAIDRTDVILDIFAQTARSQEGKAQVELALLRHRLPRLRGRGKQLSQQAGGATAGGARALIGSRGPGETQLEVDRRRLQRRIAKLERDLKALTRTRHTQRRARLRSGLPMVSLVGYTNAGKSSVLNQLTDADEYVADRLFATLDPRTRRFDLPGGEPVLLSDTVGFVRKLPHDLVEAFRSTLEVAAEADLLVHVVDAAAAEPIQQIKAVREVLTEIGAGDVPELLAFNKADLEPLEAKRLLEANPGSVSVSAFTGEGIDGLLTAIGDRIREMRPLAEFLVPYERGDVLAAIHREAEVVSETHEDEGTRVQARLNPDRSGAYAEFAAVIPAG